MIKNYLHRIRNYFLKLIPYQLEQNEDMLKILADASFRTRALLKIKNHEPINVLFVCHEPALWNMFESLYKAMETDLSFHPLVVALPYKHSTLPEDQYKDAGMFDFCETRGIKVVSGYDISKNEWLNPASLMPDYVFFQTPYNSFPSNWSVAQISMMARACYIPYYATNLFRGEVDDVVHPASFFRFVSLAFIESSFSQKRLVNKFQDQNWFNKNKVVLSGHPKLDYLIEKNDFNGKVWKRGIRKDIKRILWTPRWTTANGTCHFFNYKDFFISFCKEHQNVDFILRPHPLCLQNFLKTGELTEINLAKMEMEYDNSKNMALNRTGEYQDTFLTSDVLVSDVSSMMFEYLATGKPIVYTHRVDVYNELGRKLSECFYWVNNSTELKTTLEMLLLGNDPLKEKRKILMAEVLFIPEGGAGLRIKETIQSNFNTSAIMIGETSEQ